MTREEYAYALNERNRKRRGRRPVCSIHDFVKLHVVVGVEGHPWWSCRLCMMLSDEEAKR